MKLRSGKQTQKKHISADQMDDVDTEQDKVEDTEGKQDIKRDGDSRVKENPSLKEVNALEVDCIVGDDSEKQHKTKESCVFQKEVDSSIQVGSDVVTGDDVVSKHSNKDVRKQLEQVDKLDEKIAKTSVVEQLEEQPKVEDQSKRMRMSCLGHSLLTNLMTNIQMYGELI